MIYLGPLYEASGEKMLMQLSSTGLPNASNHFQYRFLKGLLGWTENLKIINVLPFGTWPKQFNRLFLKSRKWTFSTCECYEAGSINLPVLKQLQREKKVRNLLKKLTAQDKEVIIYSTYLPFLRGVGKLDPSVKVTLIVTDLPEFYDYGQSSAIRKLLRRINNHFIYQTLNRIDRFVLLTEQMKEPLRVGNRPYVIVEGICEVQEPRQLPVRSTQKEIIFYSGTLHYQFGIRNLLRAFEQIGQDNVELWLCGDGDAREEIEKMAAQNPCIRYWGYVSSDRIAELRSQATILVNPRTNEGMYTRYSFPSKTMEYMASGIPVVMYKLDGIPQEYREYLYFTEDDREEALTKKLRAVLSMPRSERDAFGRRAAEFVLNTKNSSIQARKVLDLIFENEQNKRL